MNTASNKIQARPTA